MTGLSRLLSVKGNLERLVWGPSRPPGINNVGVLASVGVCGFEVDWNVVFSKDTPVFPDTPDRYGIAICPVSVDQVTQQTKGDMKTMKLPVNTTQIISMLAVLH